MSTLNMALLSVIFAVAHIPYPTMRAPMAHSLATRSAFFDAGSQISPVGLGPTSFSRPERLPSSSEQKDPKGHDMRYLA